ncbi:hypothetical protein MP638_005611 [Amoeboaphelidium occidentale]|nr:hypothetical protein MP638_005611 [Amoeboaphelidium occidentale]
MSDTQLTKPRPKLITDLPVEILFLIFESLHGNVQAYASLLCSNKQVRMILKSWDPAWRLEKIFFKDSNSSKTQSTHSSYGELDVLRLSDIFAPAGVASRPRDDIEVSIIQDEVEPPSLNERHLMNDFDYREWRGFGRKWRRLLETSRGACFVRGQDLIIGSTSSTQMSGGQVFGSFGTNIITAWNIDSGQIVKRFQGHEGNVITLQVSKNMLVSSGADKSVIIWDRHDGKQILRMNFDSAIRTIKFDPVQAVCGDSQGNIHVRDTVTGRCMDKVPNICHKSDITHIVYDHKFVCSVSSDRVLQVYDRMQQKISFYYTSFLSIITTVTMSGDIVVVGTWDGGIYAFLLSRQYDGAITDYDKSGLQQRGMGSEIKIISDGTGCHTERVNCIQVLPKKSLAYFTKDDALIDDLKNYPPFVSGSNDATVGVWAPRKDSKELNIIYQCLYKLSFDSTVLSMEIVPKFDLDTIIISAACLDGKLSHWHLLHTREGYGHDETDPRAKYVRMLKQDHRSTTIKIGSQTTFNSTFMPFMIYQEFVQLLLDRDPEDFVADVGLERNVENALQRSHVNVELDGDDPEITADDLDTFFNAMEFP